MNQIEVNGSDYNIREFSGTVQSFSDNKNFILTNKQGQEHSIDLHNTPLPSVTIGQTIHAVQLTNHKTNISQFVFVRNLTTSEHIFNNNGLNNVLKSNRYTIKMGVFLIIALFIPFGFILIPLWILEYFDKIRLPSIISISQATNIEIAKQQLLEYVTQS